MLHCEQHDENHFQVKTKSPKQGGAGAEVRQVPEPRGGLGAEGAQVQVQVEGLQVRHVHTHRSEAGSNG